MTRFRSSRDSRRSQGFTIVEIMIVVAILGIIIAIAVPAMFRARLLSQQRSCQEILFKIDSATETWAIEQRKGPGAAVALDVLYASDGSGYLKAAPICPATGTYTTTSVGTDATCSITGPLDHNEKL